MATVTGYTAERMKQIEDSTVVDGTISADDLILLTCDGTPINAGNVRGPQGVPGPAGDADAVTCYSNWNYDYVWWRYSPSWMVTL